MDHHDKKNNFQRQSYIAMDDEEIFRVVEQLMQDEKIFTNHWLTMETLASHIGIHRNSLSRAVNKHGGESFPIYLSRYRVKEVERVVALWPYEKMNLARISSQAGFSNQTSFYRAFRMIHGASPSSFLIKNKNNQSNKALQNL